MFNAALSASTNLDKITDFKVVDDTINLENAIFKALTHTGTLASSAFYIGTAAADASDRIVSNKSGRALNTTPTAPARMRRCSSPRSRTIWR